MVVSRNRLEKIAMLLSLALAVGAFWFMFGRNLSGVSSYTAGTSLPEADATTAEIKAGMSVEQSFRCGVDALEGLSLVFTKQSEAAGDLKIEVLQGTEILMEGSFAAADIPDQHRTTLWAKETLSGMKGKKLKLRISAAGDTGLALMMKSGTASFRFAGRTLKGTICFALIGE